MPNQTKEPDTVFALATPPGRSAVAIVRVTGPNAGAAFQAMTRGRPLPPARVATLASLYAAESTDLLDRALVLWFEGPMSETGEDVLELHLHGGGAVTGAVLDALSRIPSLRPAGPGEFTRRAFENGKLDLTEAEAIADLVDAETSGQRRQALRQLGGALSALYDGWRERLVATLAHAEAAIDFSEEDIPADLFEAALAAARDVRGGMSRHLEDGHMGERIRQGFRIAITGAPNVGKSSLLNALAKRDVAIVTDIAGTTRDLLEVPLDLGGYAVTVVDTAGLRDTDDTVEQEGVRRARAAAATADVRIVLLDAGTAGSAETAQAGASDGSSVVVLNKSDLTPGDLDGAKGAIRISAKTGEGLNLLIGELTRRVAALATGRSEEAPPLTRLRHRQAVEAAREALDRALTSAEAGRSVELVAEDLRLAARQLGTITGRVDVEELLDRIFRDFCIGK